MAAALAKGLGWARDNLALVVCLCAGAVVRVLAMTLYSTTGLYYLGEDSERYLRLHHHAMFGDPLMPAGYPLFLAGVRAITNWLPVTIGLQHLLGLAAAAVSYHSARRLGAPRWIAILPAAFLALNGDQIFLEHLLVTEALFTPLVVAGLAAAVQAVASERPRGWLALSGALIGTASIVRTPALVLAVVVGAWAAIAVSATSLRRWLAPLTVVAAAASIVLGYSAIVHLQGGVRGLGDTAGWTLYQRVSPFADCQRFKPPAGTAQWCPTPETRRHGPSFVFSTSSPAHWAWGQPSTASKAGAFARAAIIHQPLDYLRAVGIDLARYVNPGLIRDPFSGVVPSRLSFSHTTRSNQRISAEQYASVLRSVYRTVDSHVQPGARVLGAYQAIFRVHGALVPLLLLLGVSGVVYGRDRVRLGAALFLTSALALYVVPTATLSYSARYGIPPIGPLTTAAALGLWALRQRLHSTRLTEGGHSPT